MSEAVDPKPLSSEGRVSAAVLIGSALAILLLGGALPGFRPVPPVRGPEDVTLPDALEPVGDVPAPPTVFRWQPGGPDVDFSQVTIFDARYRRLWQSAPLPGNELTIDPSVVFEGIAAGYPLSWRVREISRGRPRATSPVTDFTFDTDLEGRGIGEASPGDRRRID